MKAVEEGKTADYPEFGLIYRSLTDSQREENEPKKDAFDELKKSLEKNKERELENKNIIEINGIPSRKDYKVFE